MKSFARWLWIKLTNEDPVVVSQNFETLSRLNECHVRFIEKLLSDHPELKDTIDEHQKQRLKECSK
jgi:hypothetical protein